MAWYDQFIERANGIQGGEPVVRGTRTPVRSIIGYARVFDGNLAAVQEAFPYLGQEEIKAALAYYQDHRAEIDQEVRRHRDALKQVPAA